jgi:hypothetical protein
MDTDQGITLATVSDEEELADELPEPDSRQTPDEPEEES